MRKLLTITVTERARKLRAQYMLQAQGLRTRIEIRINRIPRAMRQAKMGELFAKHSGMIEQSKAALAPPKIRGAMLNSPSKNLIQEQRSASRQSPVSTRIAKRVRYASFQAGIMLSVLIIQSDQMLDKENDEISNPKKRVKGTGAQRIASHGVQPDQVLSPRSANSRTLPRSPIKQMASPGKSMLARPISPLKPTAPHLTGGAAGMFTNMIEKAKASRATTTRKAVAPALGKGKRTAAAASVPAPRAGRGRTSDMSESSEASSATTINKTAATKKAPAKKTVMNTLKGVGAVGATTGSTRKTAAPKAAAAAATLTMSTGRVLRKRN